MKTSSRSQKIKSLMFIVLAGLLFSSIARSVIADDSIEMLTATCTACHGQEGISSNGLWPNLAGQQRNYLAAQIRAFRDGVRVEPTMQPMVANLTDSQIDTLADYYSSLPQNSSASNEVNQAGLNVRAQCVSCHGMSGNSVTSDWPNLAGQKAAYLEKTLLDMKSGKRPSAVMSVIVEQLSEQQIKDVAEYYSQL